MLLWIIMAALTVAASLSVLIPLSRSRAGEARDASERAIYRDQLEEIERDRASGLIGTEEAEAARLEVARRLLRTEAPGMAASRASNAPGLRLGLLTGVVMIPAIALGTYLALGSPHMPDLPLAGRAATASGHEDLAALVAQVEQHLAGAPEDGRGWEVLGPVYLRLGRYDDAVRAFGNTIRILGSTAEREGLYGEALVRANGDVVSADARAAFQRAAVLDPTAVRPRFFLAIALGQDGKKTEAAAAWRALIADAPPGAPWLAPAQAELARAEGRPEPGPSAEDVAAAATKTPDERAAMIEGMVAGLAAKLDQAPDDAQGWARLFRSYMVLGQRDKAEAALARARAALSSKPERLAEIEDAARAAGILKE